MGSSVERVGLLVIGVAETGLLLIGAVEVGLLVVGAMVGETDVGDN